MNGLTKFAHGLLEPDAVLSARQWSQVATAWWFLMPRAILRDVDGDMASLSNEIPDELDDDSRASALLSDASIVVS